MNEPKCPGCGRSMELIHCFESGYTVGKIVIDPHYEASFYCLICEWKSKIEYGSTDEEAIKKAIDAANRRPLEKPLTLEEALKICESGDIVWIEDRHTSSGEYARFVEEESELSKKVNGRYAIFLGTDEPLIFVLDKCGKNWRPWKHRPTTEECTAAKWEG